MFWELPKSDLCFSPSLQEGSNLWAFPLWVLIWVTWPFLISVDYILLGSPFPQRFYSPYIDGLNCSLSNLDLSISPFLSWIVLSLSITPYYLWIKFRFLSSDFRISQVWSLVYHFILRLPLPPIRPKLDH